MAPWIEAEGTFWAWVLLTALNYAIILALVPRIILQRREPRATLAWVFFIVLVPYLGLVLFWLLGATHLRLRRWRRRIARIGLPGGRVPLAAASEAPPGDPIFPADPDLRKLATRLDAIAPSPGNRVDLYWHGPSSFDALEAAIDGAADHLHLLYYMWDPDRTGARMRDALLRAVRRGVEVRLLLDDVGSRRAPRSFFRELTAAGGRVRRFLPVSLFARGLALNHRNHRKLLLADGRTGFTGGLNVTDDYAGLPGRLPWRDAQVRVEGPAVLRLQEIFCQDWFRTCGEDLAQARYFPNGGFPGSEWAQFVASGPDERRWHAIHMLLFTAINRARERVWIETPYFVPNESLMTALVSAALRGVDVRLLLPAKTDHSLLLYAARAFYGELLAAGAKVFELPGAFLHAKLATIDASLSTIGSANFDERSLRLNFEANAFFYGPNVAQRVEEHFLALQHQARPVLVGAFEQRPRRSRVLEALARLVAPVL